MTVNRLRPLIPTLLSRISTLQIRRYTASPPKVTVQGRFSDTLSEEHRDPLLAQLKNIPRDMAKLTIEEAHPSDAEWDILGDHFTSVRDLEVDSGFEEDLNDRKLPLHWPIDRLLISSVCGQVTKSPHILQGRIKHLILYYTSEMRFEGPTSDELSAAHYDAIKRGEAEPKYLGKTSKIQIVNITELGKAWMAKKYNAPGLTENPPLEPENQPVEGHESRLRTLEIIENDALDTYLRMSAALPHVVEPVLSLTLHSTELPWDFGWLSERLFPEALAEHTKLESLNLAVGNVFSDPSTLSGLYAGLPPNLQSLHFRGPMSLCHSERWEEWVSAFSTSAFLPSLERLAFVLDLHYVPDKYQCPRPETPPDEDLREARAACERLYAGARSRGVTIEPFLTTRAGGNTARPVDERW
ncbi:uncharacterized protein DSM5745_04428 [Aspergillus mulundensis]|uniref:Uncharacterized protein n=1 Tax=Aspergillus mulundensis TaxID=1810919 RepID=A0A3D8SCM2_9EURO|nr:Uncharacterized protein DSM5745_04428 [Aspergillus mulundensis]RDW84102.1 Uncharacterized protein DSM5745_04428 [Aspergillus mulundensis]